LQHQEKKKDLKGSCSSFNTIKGCLNGIRFLWLVKMKYMFLWLVKMKYMFFMVG